MLTPGRRRYIELFIEGLPLDQQNPYRSWPAIARELLDEIDRLNGVLVANDIDPDSPTMEALMEAGKESLRQHHPSIYRDVFGEDMTNITITTRRPEKWELIDHDENKHWVIKDGSWWQLYGPFETKDVME